MGARNNELSYQAMAIIREAVVTSLSANDDEHIENSFGHMLLEQAPDALYEIMSGEHNGNGDWAAYHDARSLARAAIELCYLWAQGKLDEAQWNVKEAIPSQSTVSEVA